MLKYILKRIAMFVPTALLISVIVFFIIQLPPGDYVTSYISKMEEQGEYFTQEMIDQMREQYGLNDPWYVQYGKWMKGIILEGDFGYSFTYQKDVWAVIMTRLPLTITVSIVIMIFTYLMSIPIGIYSATHQYSFGDYFWSVIGFLGMSVPNFLLAFILMFLSFKYTGNALVGLFTQDMLENGIHWYNLGDFLQRMIIPTVVIGTANTCGIIRQVRGQMLDEQTKQYTLTLRAKGVSGRRVIYKYCMRAALNPVVSGLSGSLASIFSGSTISAIVMNMALVGPMLYDALKNQDMYLAGTIVLIMGILVILGTLISDIVLAWMDPRIRYAKGGRD